ncbi:MAG: nicotinate (nicotinamide) nucleotide adenylyltransferase [Treponema sp.]
MKLALLGGSYNPIHIGHLALADAVCQTYSYDKIAFVPAFLSPFKEAYKNCSLEDRITMVQHAIQGNPTFYCELCEVHRGGVSYTIDTVQFLYKTYPQIEGKIGLIIGDDLLAQFYQWHQAEKLLTYVDLIAGKRNSDPCTTGSLPPHQCLANEILPLSSTAIRNAITEKKSWRYLVPPAVYTYITEHNLYGYTAY